MAPTHAPAVDGGSTDPAAPRRPDPRDVPRRTVLVARPVGAVTTDAETPDLEDTTVGDTDAEGTADRGTADGRP
jgi:hypothetical protein